MSKSFPNSPVAPSPAAVGDVRAHLQNLWRYRPGFDYSPDLFLFAEFRKTDRDYVVLDVGMMMTGEHSEHLDPMGNAVRFLIARFCERPIYVSLKVGINEILGRMFASDRHTPLWVRTWRPGPLLCLRTRTPSTGMVGMKRPGWCWCPMHPRRCGITIWATSGQAYARLCIEVGPVDGQASRAQGTSLRWVGRHPGVLACRVGALVPVVEIPGTGAGPAMDSLPGTGALMRTQADLGQLRRHIPMRHPGRTTAADHQYVTELPRACPSYPEGDFPGRG